MLNFVTLIILLSRMPNDITTLRACTPNSQFLVNGRLCFCDSRGRWSEAHCKTISRRQSCQPGQIIWQACNQCICQENGYLLCGNSHCPDDLEKAPPRQALSTFGLRCTPFKTYYINCSICVCPASGIATEAQCVTDVSCNTQTYGTDIASTTKSYCVPNIIYLSPCMQCLCSDHGGRDSGTCADVCGSETTNSPANCIPGQLFRIGCNLCQCPDNSVPDKRFCISGICSQQSKRPFPSLRSESTRCVPHTFTTPRCMYCDCNASGIINENVCIELDCAKTHELSKNHIVKDTCNPGEMVAICIECFCSRDGQIVAKYCSRVCSYQHKLIILEKILNDSNSMIHFLERSKIERLSDDRSCTPNSLYIDSEQYCLCPENGDPNIKFCTSVNEEPKRQRNHDSLSNKIEVDFTAPCEPNTFVQFECNTCYCNKNGVIPPKWCTYDDCEAKQLVRESHKIHNPASMIDKTSITCNPGSISKSDCNFCICLENGILKELVCTKNDCTDINNSMYNEKLTCEPLAYYEVECNICYCPREGIKNVAKCTKNQCEKNVLRSDTCSPGELFSDECNVCVCPPDGNKMGKACTNHICHKTLSWELLKLAHSSTGNHLMFNHTKSLDQCFPGEEYVNGCKLCICPDQGLKMYATCESVLCDDDTRYLNASDLLTTDSINKTHPRSSWRSRRATNDCFTYNVSHSAERQECTPGTLYIIRCKQCICPYFGNINNFCRPLPKNIFCEQAFPYFNYLPMGRRGMKDSRFIKSSVNSTERTSRFTPKETKFKTPTSKNIEIKVKHEHTKYNCEKPGTIVDRCFICDCEETLVVIEEHCFRSDAPNCIDAKPSFLVDNKVDL